MKSWAPYLLLLILAFTLIGLFRPGGRVESPEAAQKLWVTPPPLIERFAFGYHEILADLLWLRVIQDMDVCNKPQASKFEAPVSTPRLPHAQEANAATQDILARLNKAHVIRKKNCDLSWPFFMMDAATNLSPQFRMVYISGGVTLSVLVEDFEGAGRLFDKGLKNVKDWSLTYRAAYHYLYDRQDYQKAADLMQLAADYGAPSWVRSLAARLYTLSGQAELAASILIRQLEDTDNPKAAEELKARIEVLKNIVAEERLKKKQAPPSISKAPGK